MLDRAEVYIGALSILEGKSHLSFNCPTGLLVPSPRDIKLTSEHWRLIETYCSVS
jgi:hypothetical protein